MKKHEMSSYKKNDFIEFIFDFYSHSKKMMNDIKNNKEKNIFSRNKIFFDESKCKILESLSIKKNIKIVIKILSRKDRESNNLFRKNYKSNQSNQVVFSKSGSSSKKTSKNSKSKIDVFVMNIAMIEIFVFNMMSKKKKRESFLDHIEKREETFRES